METRVVMIIGLHPARKSETRRVSQPTPAMPRARRKVATLIAESRNGTCNCRSLTTGNAGQSIITLGSIPTLQAATITMKPITKGGTLLSSNRGPKPVDFP
jgi:hypothetical protein